jgi:hypothetical protein
VASGQGRRPRVRHRRRTGRHRRRVFAKVSRPEVNVVAVILAILTSLKYLCLSCALTVI